MTTNRYKVEMIGRLREDGILNDSILNRIMASKSEKVAKTFVSTLIKRKRKVVEIEKELRLKGVLVWFSAETVLQNLDGKSYKRLKKKANEVISFVNRKLRVIGIAKKNRFSYQIISQLVAAKSMDDLNKILDQIPPILLDRLKLRKLKRMGSVSTRGSIRAISTPMRD